MLTDKYVIAAKITLDECLKTRAVPVAVPVQAPVIEPKIVIVPAAATPAPEPRIITTTKQTYSIGSCQLNRGQLTNVCKRFLDDAVLRLQNKPGARLQLTGPIEAGKAVQYLNGKIDQSRIEQQFSDSQNSTLSLELTWTE
jgi:hypothetical protein